MRNLVITATIGFEDESDLDFMRVNLVGRVEDSIQDKIEEVEDEKRLDGKVTVNVDWEIEDE